MNSESKVKNVAKNTIMGILNNLALVALNLISRKMFLRYIGIDYLSIGQVINNILSILAFSELGVANSVLYMLYRPVAKNDTERIARIIGSYKKINRIIGCIIIILGIMCMPFLNRFIHTSIDINIVYSVFILNLLYSSSTYFCSYRQVLINANQKNYIISRISLVINFTGIIIQIVIIYFTHNYIIYLIVIIAMGVLQNIILYKKAGNMFPFLEKYKTYRLNENESKVLLKNVKSMFSVKICGIVINNTDNILISVINTLMVGYCANYSIISTRIKGLISIFHNSIIYSLGIASVEKNNEDRYQIFKKFQLVNIFIAGITSVLIGVLWNDFIKLWLGQDFVISDIIIYSMLLNYLWSTITASIWIFRDANGLFVYVRHIILANALLNLVISILLGKFIGVAGVYFATIIADILTDFWYDAKLVYIKLFGKKNPLEYFVEIFFNIAIIVIMVILIKYIFRFMEITVLNFIIKGAITTCAYLVIFCSVYGMNPVFKSIVNTYILSKIKSGVNRYE